eukprot:7214045-Pyramimonas_sp.AAC.1
MWTRWPASRSGKPPDAPFNPKSSKSPRSTGTGRSSEKFAPAACALTLGSLDTTRCGSSLPRLARRMRRY